LPEPFDSDGGRTFDYPMFLAKDGILYTLAFAEAEGTDESVAWQPGNVAKTLAIGTKQLFLRGLHAAIPEPEAGLASGITVGEKRSMGEDLTEAFTRSSLIHIVVLSGYNITIVINGASRFLECAPRSARFGASGLIVTFFILMTGGAATAVRAGLMALIAVYARTSGRVFLAFRALAFACFVMVAWNPYTLLYDPSFQLSALATLGLILFTPRFVAVLRWVPRKMGMREIVASTIATQLTVLPLLLYQSGNLSLVALPANVLVLAAIPLAMALSAIASVSGLIAPLAAPLFGLPAYALLSYIITVAESFAALPFAAFSVQSFSAWWLIVAYIGIAALYRLFPQGEGAQ
jgi:competence protein ComEC